MREWRTLAGLNATEAGACLGLSGRAIEDIEQGRRRVDDELARIALNKLIDLMREWRTLAGLNATEAGARLGLSGRAIEDIEQGRRRVDDELARIALNKLIDDAK